MAPAIAPMKTPRIITTATMAPSQPVVPFLTVANAIPAKIKPPASAPGHTPSAAHKSHRFLLNGASAAMPIPTNDSTTKMVASDVSA
jgi:hypothetical protein